MIVKYTLTKCEQKRQKKKRKKERKKERLGIIKYFINRPLSSE